MIDLKAEKARLRVEMRKMRQALLPEAKQQASNHLTQLVTQSPYFKKAMHIAAYFALPEEIDPKGILEAAFMLEKKCYLPVLNADGGLSFRAFTKNTELRPNRFGILEPEPNTNHVTVSDLDLVLVPLVAFDLQGHRLGMGKGYYDRTFKGKLSTVPALLGLAFECQRVENVPVDQNDVKLTAVATEQNLYGI